MMGKFFGTILAALFGLAGGGFTAAGVFALISAVNLIPRFAGQTKTEAYIKLYEWMIILGGITGNLFYFYNGKLPMAPWLGSLCAGIGGLCTGIFVGSLAMSLAETLDGIAVFGRRFKLTKGVAFVILCVAVGKITGSLLQFFWGFAKAD